ncbi:hypothetical protein ABMA27_007561 [Loxostege sticticalis]|uniref:Peptidase S1 domain-containing protein n=1 Tax=Loxostege sticticalis TaxID=481309 RepID=A0ABR3HFV0_LOXSC
MFEHEKLVFLLVIVRLRGINCAMEERVIAGVETRIEEYPHSVFLLVKCNAVWMCGASILNQEILLTAGHCVTSCQVDTDETHIITGYVGHEDLRKVTITRTAKDLVVHENYNDYSLENDVAIVMTESIPLSDKSKRVILHCDWSFPNTPIAYVAGWGIYDESTPNKGSKILMSVKQSVKTPEICEVIGYLTPGMFCAGSTRAEDPRAARGDSGSALVYREFHQIGIVSFKVKSYPALMVYTNVTYYYQWIQTKSDQLYCKSTETTSNQQ